MKERKLDVVIKPRYQGDTEMALKLRETIKYPDSMGMQDTFAKIYFDSELAEYQVKVTIDGKAVSQATYYTDDLDDARQTAKAMIS